MRWVTLNIDTAEIGYDLAPILFINVCYISIQVERMLSYIHNLLDTLMLQGEVTLIYGVDIVNKNVCTGNFFQNISYFHAILKFFENKS